MLSRRHFIATSMAGTATLAWPLAGMAQERSVVTIPPSVSAMISENHDALNRAGKNGFEQAARGFLFQRSKYARVYSQAQAQLLALTDRRSGQELAMKAGKNSFGADFDARSYARMFHSENLRQSYRIAGKLLTAKNPTFAKAVLPGLVLSLAGFGLSAAQINKGMQTISAGMVSVDFSRTQVVRGDSQIGFSRLANGKLRLDVAKLNAGIGAGHLAGNGPAPSESAQGFWKWLKGAANAVLDFYLDLMWNEFMGASAGAGLGGSIGGPFGALIGAVAGAGAGMWYTIGKKVTGGFWLGPGGTAAPDYCIGPPIGLC